MINPLTLRSLCVVASLTPCLCGPAASAPVALDDSYTTAEDTPFTASGRAVVSGNFDVPVTGQANFTSPWQYLDTLTNGVNGTPVRAYPVDSASRPWTHAAFNTATSSITGWKTSAAPMVGPAGTSINAFATLGLTPVLNGQAEVTTYLFRNSFSLTAAEAGIAQWTLRYLFDDGVVIYVNGQEVTRLNMPGSAVTTSTFADISAFEDGYTDVPIDLTGRLVAGTNSIAIELHQSNGSTDAAFALSLTAAPDSDGFSYVDDAFGTASPIYASGSVGGTLGFNGGGVNVRLDPRNQGDPGPVSGAWRRQFSLPAATPLVVSTRYRLTAGSGFEPAEFVDAILEVDGVRYGTAHSSPVAGTSLHRFIGNGNGGSGEDSGWQSASFTIAFTGGTHTISLGAAYNNSTDASEFADVYFDDVVIGTAGASSQPSVLSNDVGTGLVSATRLTQPAHGSLTFSVDGNFTYSPASDFSGIDSFTYTATDATGTSAPATVTINVSPMNDPPVAAADAYSGNEDAAITVPAPGILANDTDSDGDNLGVELRTDVANGTLALNNDGSFLYTPKTDFFGTDSFVYRARDASGFSSSVTVTLTVNPTNDAPIAVNDSYQTAQNTPLVVTLASGGTATTEILIPRGSTVPPGDPAEANLPEWRYLDDGSNQGTAWRAPGFNDAAWTPGKAELGYGDGPDGRPERTEVGFGGDPGARFATTYFRLAFPVAEVGRLSSPRLHLLRDDAAAIYLNGTLIFTDSSLPIDPPHDFYVQSAIGDEANLVELTSSLSPATESLFVEGTNVLAVEIHQAQPNSSDISLDLELTTEKSPPLGVLANDTDADGSPLTASLLTLPTHGTVSLNANGTFTYTPAVGYRGPDSFTYRASDGLLNSAPATASITVITGPNVPPFTNPDSYAGSEDAVLIAGVATGVLANDSDPDGDSMTAEMAVPPLHGSVVLNANGSFIYTPAADFNGADSFSYRARDSVGNLSALAEVILSMAPVNDPPVAAADQFGTNPGETLAVPAASGVLANDTDPDTGTTLNAQLINGPGGAGTLTLATNGSFNFIPAAGFTGTATFTYRATDGTLNSNPATVTIIVDGRPLAGIDAYTLNEDVALTVPPANGVLKNDSDPEIRPLTAVLVTPPTHGTLALSPSGAFTYSPDSNYNGPDSFVYEATDGGRSSQPATVSLTVNSVNDPPLAQPDFYEVTMNQAFLAPIGGGVLANDSDPDHPVLTAELVNTTVQGTLALASNGGFTYVPSAEFIGTDSFSYRAGDGIAQSEVVTVVLDVTATTRAVVISEIMFSPPDGDRRGEFIELYNTASYPIDLGGWRFDRGVDVTLPAGTIIAAGGRVIVAADPAFLTSRYPGLTNLVPVGWGPEMGLSNRGESVRVLNARGIEADQVDYSDQGDWGRRRAFTQNNRTGWEWMSFADPDPVAPVNNPGGGSLQLRNPALRNDQGQNWAAAAPTPGLPNSVTDTDIEPMISDVKHRPVLPGPTNQVHVTALLEDELDTGVTAVVLYRTWPPRPYVGVPTATPWTEVAMADDGLHRDRNAGDGEWGATLPAQPAAGTVVEFYVRAADQGGNIRTWPAAALDTAGNPVQSANCLYQVNAEAYSGAQPLFRLVMTSADDHAFDVSRWNSNSDAQLNATFIAQQGTDLEVRYLAGVRVRGNSSRGWNPRNWHLALPHDTDWNGHTTFNLNTKYIYSQLLGSKMLESAGVPREEAMIVQARLNGENHADDAQQGSPAFTYGSYVCLIPRGTEMANDQFPADDGGTFYSKIRTGGSWETRAAADSGYQNLGWTRETNTLENDWTDLHQWLGVMNSASGPNYYAQIAPYVDVDEWARWFAVCTIVNHMETSLSNGDDDDYGVYFGVADRRARLLAHDLDTLFDIGEIGNGAEPTATIYQATDPSFTTSPTIPQMDAFYRDRVCGRKFKAALRELLEGPFSKPSFDALLESCVPTSWIPAGSGIQATIRDFMDARRTHILGLLPRTFTASLSLPQQAGYYRTTSATGLGGLGGVIDPTRTARVTVNGIAVSHDVYSATWAAGSTIALPPGVSTLECVAWDEADVEIGRATIPVWFDDGSVQTRSGILSANESWTPTAGPYHVTSNLTVGNGITLTVQPGTGIYLNPGATITVSGTGRLLAEGSPSARITLTRPPGTAGTWGRLTFTGSLESRLSYADISFAGANGVISGNGANLVLDHLSFSNTSVRIFDFTLTSFVVSNSVIPDIAGAHVLRAFGIPVAGRAIVRENRFGRTTGLNDIINITGGQRPDAIAQIIGNVFAGSGDDVIELNGADCWIENNVFAGVHQQSAGADTANAISAAQASEFFAVRNIFHDCDHACLARDGSFGRLVNNSVNRISTQGGVAGSASAFNLQEGVSGHGAGFEVDATIVRNCPVFLQNFVAGATAVTVNRSLLPDAGSWTGGGAGNFVGDPYFVNPPAGPVTSDHDQLRAALALRPGSPAQGTGPNGIDMGAAVPHGPSIVGPPSPTSATGATLSIGGPGITEYRFSVDGGTFSAELPVAAPVSVGGLSPGPHLVRVAGRTWAGEWDAVDGATEFAWIIDPAAPAGGSIEISEILADNVNAYANGTAHPDFIELRNPSPTAVDLAGWTITDDRALPERFAFAPGTIIAPGGYLILHADADLAAPGIHLGFGLDADGDQVHLFSGTTMVDSVSFGPQVPDYSIARIGAAGQWALATPTPDAPNVRSPLGDPAGLRINEWLSANDFIIEGDFVELFNSDPRPVALDGIILTDDLTNWAALRSIGSGGVHTIAPLTFVSAAGFVRFLADGETSLGPHHLSFAISRVHESLALVDRDGTPIDFVLAAPGLDDMSQGRLPDGGLTVAQLPLPTPGFSNLTNLDAAADLRDHLRVTEIHYHPASGNQSEFVELRNTGATPLDLTGVRFVAGISFEFGATSLAPGAYAVLVDNPAAFAAQFPAVPIAGGYSGKLDNGGEQLRIEIAGYPIGILDFEYRDGWHPSTDGQGPSLQIVDASLPAGKWDERESWQAGPLSPGGSVAFGTTAGSDQVVVLPADAILDGTVFPGGFDPSEVNVSWTVESGPAPVVFTAPSNEDTDASFNTPGEYVLKLTVSGPGGVEASDSIGVMVQESYNLWAARLLGGMPPGDQLASADPDRDSLANGIEFAIGTHPGTATTGQPSLTVADGHLTLAYTRSKLADSSTLVIPEISSDMVGWLSGGAALNVSKTGETESLEMWQAVDPSAIGSSPYRFLRLKIITP